MKKTTAASALVLAAGSAALLAWMAQAGGAAPPKPPKPAPLVSTAVVHPRGEALELSLEGHVRALSQVDIRSQLTGTIRSVHFREGELVRAGELLFMLDDSSHSAQLARARAQTAQIKAELIDAQRKLERSLQMVQSGFISANASETLEARVAELQAQRAAAQAEIASARIQLERTRISAPIDGRTGAVNVHPGSLVQAGAGAPLVTLVQLDPVGVAFALPEPQLDALRDAQRRGKATVTLDEPNGAAAAAPQRRVGQLTFIDSSVDPASATIAVKASFANPGHALWPGAFARVVVGLGTVPDASVLPAHAVLDGPDGHFVYVIGSGGKAERRAVAMLRIRQQQAIVTGLGEGERVVIDGGAKVREGKAVRIARAGMGGRQ
ncbi:efflux RND transporter periplasmic adaptor subunit [Massilia cavernae]|uniref:Efflux RND transporter periplasmic adaptor subunit n=1 Tax=Massilia cavernae TaxID=2320864 RepID=A0A418Y4J7_9BURK|nr:efflux RND transporter periplasmic adaptor subunit [Massilia cavernae]RJG20736.1 efflux RND transporter periplasmic adaptor subunit [Massilia cavernae]